MALSFLASHPPTRTRQSHLRTIHTESGRTTIEFSPSSSSHALADATVHAMRTIVPAGKTIHDPPYHWHKYQTETFTVLRGTFLANVEGVQTPIKAGSTVTVEAGQYHTFTNPSQTEELEILTGLDPAERERDEAFFRNLYGYLDDCEKAKISPSLCQILLWLWTFDCYLALPGPKWLMRIVSQIMVWVLGVVVGKYLLGYQQNYEEYFAGDVDKVLHKGGRTGRKEL